MNETASTFLLVRVPGAEYYRYIRDGEARKLIALSGRTPKDLKHGGASYEEVIKADRAGCEGIAAYLSTGEREYYPYPAASALAPAPATTTAPAPGFHAPARFTCLRYLHPIGKRFDLDAAGVLQKKTLADGARATAHIVECETIERLEQAFRDASDTDIFVGGLPSSDGLTVVTKAKRSDGEIARSKDDLPFRGGPGVMFLDNDHPVGEGDDQFDAYVKAVPALAAASYVYAPSSSAWIHDSTTGSPLKGAGGQHYAVPVQDALDIPRALKALHQRLVLAELGEPMVTRAGTVLIKSPVDTAMQTPNQALFQRVSLGGGLVQRKADHIGSHRGDVFLFDSRLIVDLTPEEQVQLDEIERQLRESVAYKASEARNEWVAERVESVSARNKIPREVAVECLRAALTQTASDARVDLIPGIQVMFGDGLVDVADLLANPKRYDGKPCADPLEPDYRGGIGVAKFFANVASGKPTINSMAHGSQVFFLHHDIRNIEGLIQNLRLGVTGAGEVGRSPKHDVLVPAAEEVPSAANPMSDWRPPPAPAQTGQHAVNDSASGAWPEPADPFVDHAAPQFPVDHLPEAMAKYCHEVSAGSGFDAGAYGFALLIAAANLIDHRARLSSGPLSVPPVLWGGIVAPAGRGKSPVMGAAMKFSHRINDELVHASLQEREAFLKIHKGMKPKDFEALDQPPWRQLIATDTTIEALGGLLKDNPTGLLLAYDELTEFVGRMDAYNGGTGKDRGTYLQAYDGGSKTINRKGSIMPLVVENFSVGVLTGVQPEKLAELFKKSGGADGLFQRFLVYSVPVPGGVNYAATVGAFTETNCAQVFERLHEWSRIGVISRLTVEPTVLALMEDYHKNARIIAQHTPNPRLGEHFDKFPGFLARMLLALHCMECAAQGRFSAVVSVETFNRAHAIANVLYRHSEAVYGEFAQHGDDSFRLLKSACEAILTKRWSEFGRADLTRHATGWRDADDREAQGAIDLLIEFDWVREFMPEKTPGRAGRRSVGVFKVNELVHQRFVEQSQRFANQRAARYAAIQKVAATRRGEPWK